MNLQLHLPLSEVLVPPCRDFNFSSHDNHEEGRSARFWREPKEKERKKKKEKRKQFRLLKQSQAILEGSHYYRILQRDNYPACLRRVVLQDVVKSSCTYSTLQEILSSRDLKGLGPQKVHRNISVWSSRSTRMIILSIRSFIKSRPTQPLNAFGMFKITVDSPLRLDDIKFSSNSFQVTLCGVNKNSLAKQQAINIYQKSHIKIYIPIVQFPE